jgi:hypothetical protein
VAEEAAASEPKAEFAHVERFASSSRLPPAVTLVAEKSSSNSGAAIAEADGAKKFAKIPRSG